MTALVREASQAPAGIETLSGDLDRPETLAMLGGTADAVLHLAPPDDRSEHDSRTRNLIDALSARGMLPRRVVYISTSGVYGDCAGGRVDESRVPAPRTDRARRRLHAEMQLSQWTGMKGIPLVILRVPGIYAAERLPLERLRARTPVLRAAEDVYTSHIHAEDLAAIASRALEKDAPPGLYNAADDTEMKMGDWLDLVADVRGLPRPQRIARTEAAAKIPPGLLSFMGESRRLDNRRLKQVLGVRLRYPSVHEGLRHEHAIGVDQSP